MNLLLAIGIVMGGCFGKAQHGDTGTDIEGNPVDIASSAYQYRADRQPAANPPESWIAVKHFAKLPLNKPVDANLPAVRSCLTALLWEEIRPVQTLELTWHSSSKRRPNPDELEVAALTNMGESSSWWNNLASVPQPCKPVVSNDGRTYSYPLGLSTCGLVVRLADGKIASHFDVPHVRVLVADVWKSMDIEIEWGFDTVTAPLDYGGHLETYDGRIANLHSLDGDETTSITDGHSWRSTGRSESRRGVQMSLLYMGISKWRKVQTFTSQADDVARTIVTIWTKSGSFSFLAADLENGPIYAPEYGFFVRRTSAPNNAAKAALPPSEMTAVPLTAKMEDIAGDSHLKGWGSNETPWFGSNPTDQFVSVLGIAFPAKFVAMHPGQSVDVVAQWRSPVKGTVKMEANLAHLQAGGNGIDWSIMRATRTKRETLAFGETNGQTSQAMPLRKSDGRSLEAMTVEPGDTISLVIGPKGDHRCDSTAVDWTITEVGGQERSWNLATDVANSVHDGNPHRDSQGNPDVWQFCSAPPMIMPGPPSEPPIELSSDATSARAFVDELKSRGYRTIRELTRSHLEQTWEDAVTETRGADLPPHPIPPSGSEPAMRISVPSERMTAQWNLGAWHLLRHCGKNPQTGKLWFNDYPYGILAAETYLILSVLDQMSMHDEAADGFDQWLSLPMDREHPVGLFTDGRGALTYAVGPEGAGGHMDGIHSFGPGSIGWALTQHYWMTGDTEWLKRNAPRMIANADWMLRQRQVMSDSVPGGKHLWCRGLQPPLQVTPDSGGLWMQFYECEAYYWASISRLAETVEVVDPSNGARLKAEAEAYRKDLKAAVERSIALSPVVPIRDGTFHSVVPFACYVRGLATGAWGWRRDGSGSHVGPLYWDTVQSAAALVSPAALLDPHDVRVQGYLDVLEDRLLLENPNVGNCNWFYAGWQYQGGLERTPNMHLADDDVPVFLRSFYNCYAVDILPKDGYVFNEHAVHGPPDKIFEEAAFLERFRNMLVMEDGDNLWLTRATPHAWLKQGEHISVTNAPTRFGTVAYEIVSDIEHGKISASISITPRRAPRQIWLRLRHPDSLPIKTVTVNGKPWKEFDANLEIVRLNSSEKTMNVEVGY